MRVDGVPGLIEQAQEAGGGDFRVPFCEKIAAGEISLCVDAAVCNCTLIGNESVEGLFSAAQSVINSTGTFIVQTLHPVIACPGAPYQDGWREGSWVGLSLDFTYPAPSCFRTLESCIQLFVAGGSRLVEMREPLHPKIHKSASMIFTAEVVACDNG